MPPNEPTAVKTIVQEYTLQLGSQQELAIMHGSKLLRLSVSVPRLEPGTRAKMKAAAAVLAAELGDFITSASDAVQSVNHIHISLPRDVGSAAQKSVASAALNALFLPLAAACPELQRFSMTGRIGSDLLLHFGTRCPKLTCLDVVLANIATDTLQNLSALLPHLKSLSALTCPFAPVPDCDDDAASNYDDMAAQYRLLASMYDEEGSDYTEKQICIALQACPRLITFDSGSSNMTDVIWAALPKGLTSIACSLTSGLDKDELPLHTSVNTLTIHGHEAELSSLVALLASAPNVCILRISDSLKIAAILSRAGASDIQHLDARLSSRLVVLGIKGGPCSDASSERASINLELSLYSQNHGDSEFMGDRSNKDYPLAMCDFMAASIMAQPLLSITHIHFIDASDEVALLGELDKVHQVFPSLSELAMSNLALFDIRPLADCESLSKLTLIDIKINDDGITFQDVEQLCTMSPSLQSVRLERCNGMLVNNVDQLTSNGGKLSGVSVVVILSDQDEIDHAEERNMHNDTPIKEESRYPELLALLPPSFMSVI